MYKTGWYQTGKFLYHGTQCLTAQFFKRCPRHILLKASQKRRLLNLSLFVFPFTCLSYSAIVLIIDLMV